MNKFARLSGLLFAILSSLSAVWAGTYEYSFDFSPADVTIRSAGSDESVVDLKGGECNLGNPGRPWIPSRDFSVRLPAGEVLSSWSVETGDAVLLAEGLVPVPEQAPVPLDARADELAPTPRDEASYASADPYPAHRGEHLMTGCMRGISIASFRLSPIWYVASEKRLHLATRLTVKVTTSRPRTLQGLSAEDLPVSSLFESAANSLVVNPSEPSARKEMMSVSRAGSGCQYLVITTRALASAAQRLADFRAGFDGVTAAVVTIEDIQANSSWSDLRPDGKTDVQTKIRSCIRWYVQNRGTEYVVLAGDDKVVPKREVRVAEQSLGHTDAPSDLYYGDLDGDWDANRDGTYGYTASLDGGDLLPDVIVGRIPVQTSAQLADYVSKVIAYEQETTDDSDIVRKTLWLGYTLWQDLERTSSGWSIVENGSRGSSISSITETFGDGLQEIKDRAAGLWANDAEFWLRRFNKTYHRTYRPNLRTTFCTGSATSWDNQKVGDYNLTAGPNGTVHQVFNQGYHQVFLNTHGTETGFSVEGTKTLTSGSLESYKSSTAVLLTNRVDFVYAEACHNGAFDSRTDPCQAEAFLRAKGGSLAYIACSREGWGTKMGSTYWTSQGATRGISKSYAQQFWNQIFRNGVKKLGPAFAAHKAALVSSCSSYGAERWIQLLTNLLGDPLLTYHLPPADEPNPRQSGKPGLVTLLRDDLPEATASSLSVRVAVDEIPLGSSASVVLEYSRSANFDSGVTSVPVSSSVTRCCELTQRITGLSADTLYYVRAKMTMNGTTHSSPFSCGFRTQRADYVSPTPIISPASCTFAPYVEVNVSSAVSDVVIRYTTDGSSPTSASPVWSGTLVVDDSMTVRARAFRGNVAVGGESEARYDYDTERLGPKGDAFTDPIVIRGDSGSYVVNEFSPYTVEEDEFDHSNGSLTLRRTCWFEWTAPGTGTVTLRPKFSHESVIYSVSFAVYTGDTMSGLSRLASFGMSSGSAASGTLTFSARQGTTYRFVAASRVLNMNRNTMFLLDWSGDLAVGSEPVLDSVRAPLIETEGGRFYPSTNVTISCRTPGSTIRYTTDGSVPTESSRTYTQPIRLTESATVRARAFKSGMKPSLVVSATFLCSDHDILEPGDAFDDPIVIEGVSGSKVLRIEKFTFDEADPKPRDLEVNPSVWFKWTAPGSGRMTFSAQCKGDDGSTHWVAVGAYSGDSLSALTEKVVAFPNSVKMDLAVDVIQGQTYRILSGTSLNSVNSSGNFTFSWSGELTTETQPGPGTDPDPGPGPGTDPDPEVEQETLFFTEISKHVLTTTNGADAVWSATATGSVRLMSGPKTSVDQLTATGARFEVSVHGYTAGGSGTVTVTCDGVTVKVLEVTVLADLDESAVATKWTPAVKRKTLRVGESLSVDFCHPTNAKYWRYADGEYNETPRTVYTYSGAASVVSDPACTESSGAHYTTAATRSFSATFTGTEPGRVFVAILFGSGSSNQRHYAGVYELTFEAAGAETWDVPGVTGGINGTADVKGGKSVTFRSISLVDGKLKVDFEADRVSANGQTFGLVCKENLSDTETFTINVTLTDDGTGSATLGSLEGLTDRPRLFILGIGPAAR